MRAIGVDEIQWGRGHHYLTLVYQIEVQCVRLLWVGKERTVESFQQFFTLIGQELADTIEFVCSDMWQPYLRAHCAALHARAQYPGPLSCGGQAQPGAGRRTRRRGTRMAREGFEPVLKKKRWCLLKRPENLTDQQRIRLRELLGYNLKSVRAYLLKEEFQQFWDYDLPDLGRQVSRSRGVPAPCAHGSNR